MKYFTIFILLMSSCTTYNKACVTIDVIGQDKVITAFDWDKVANVGDTIVLECMDSYGRYKDYFIIKGSYKGELPVDKKGYRYFKGIKKVITKTK